MSNRIFVLEVLLLILHAQSCTASSAKNFCSKLCDRIKSKIPRRTRFHYGNKFSMLWVGGSDLCMYNAASGIRSSILIRWSILECHSTLVSAFCVWSCPVINYFYFLCNIQSVTQPEDTIWGEAERQNCFSLMDFICSCWFTSFSWLLDVFLVPIEYRALKQRVSQLYVQCSRNLNLTFF